MHPHGLLAAYWLEAEMAFLADGVLLDGKWTVTATLKVVRTLLGFKYFSKDWVPVRMI
jgi:hypothetical protein